MVTRTTPTHRLLRGEGSLSDTEIVSQGQMSHVHLSAVRQQDGYRIVIRNFVSKKNAYNITSPLHSHPKQNLNKASEKKEDWRLDRKEGRKGGGNMENSAYLWKNPGYASDTTTTPKKKTGLVRSLKSTLSCKGSICWKTTWEHLAF